jgi:hypothetical protein
MHEVAGAFPGSIFPHSSPIAVISRNYLSQAGWACAHPRADGSEGFTPDESRAGTLAPVHSRLQRPRTWYSVSPGRAAVQSPLPPTPDPPPPPNTPPPFMPPAGEAPAPDSQFGLRRPPPIGGPGGAGSPPPSPQGPPRPPPASRRAPPPPPPPPIPPPPNPPPAGRPHSASSRRSCSACTPGGDRIDGIARYQHARQGVVRQCGKGPEHGAHLIPWPLQALSNTRGGALTNGNLKLAHDRGSIRAA